MVRPVQRGVMVALVVSSSFWDRRGPPRPPTATRRHTLFGGIAAHLCLRVRLVDILELI